MNEINGPPDSQPEYLKIPISDIIRQHQNLANMPDIPAESAALERARCGMYASLHHEYDGVETLADVVQLLRAGRAPQEAAQDWLDRGLFAPGDPGLLSAVATGYPALSDKALSRLAEADQMKARHAYEAKEFEKFHDFES